MTILETSSKEPIVYHKNIKTKKHTQEIIHPYKSSGPKHSKITQLQKENIPISTLSSLPKFPVKTVRKSQLAHSEIDRAINKSLRLALPSPLGEGRPLSRGITPSPDFLQEAPKLPNSINEIGYSYPFDQSHFLKAPELSVRKNDKNNLISSSNPLSNFLLDKEIQTKTTSQPTEIQELAIDDSLMFTEPESVKLYESEKQPREPRTALLDDPILETPISPSVDEMRKTPPSDKTIDSEMVELSTLPKRIPKGSTFHLYYPSYIIGQEDYEGTKKFNAKLQKTLATLGVPAELVKIEEVFSDKTMTSIPSEVNVTILLSWREVRALVDESSRLQKLLLPNGGASHRLRPLSIDREADTFVGIAREAIGNNSSNEKTLPRWELPSGTDSYRGILTSAFSDFQGVCFGELHNNPKDFLIDLMGHMKTCGVKLLFMEHLMYDTMQLFLDQYFSDKPNAKMPVPLAAYLQNLDRGFNLKKSPYNFTALVKAAKMHGIRIVGIDTSLSYEAGYDSFGSGGINRYLAMNHVAKKIIEWEAGWTTKYIALMGIFHGATTQISGRGETISADESVPGVAELLEIPFIALENSQENVNLIQQNVDDYLEGSISSVNMVISGYQPDKPLNISQQPIDEDENEEI